LKIWPGQVVVSIYVYLLSNSIIQLVPANVWRCCAAVKLTVDLISHWPCITVV